MTSKLTNSTRQSTSFQKLTHSNTKNTFFEKSGTNNVQEPNFKMKNNKSNTLRKVQSTVFINPRTNLEQASEKML